jgi:hypothetical protein
MLNVERIQMAQDRDQWRSAVNTIMNIQFCKGWGLSWLSEQLLDSHEGLISLELFTVSYGLQSCTFVSWCPVWLTITLKSWVQATLRTYSDTCYILTMNHYHICKLRGQRKIACSTFTLLSASQHRIHPPVLTHILQKIDFLILVFKLTEGWPILKGDI